MFSCEKNIPFPNIPSQTKMLECPHIIERKIFNHNFGPAFQQAAGSSFDPGSPIAYLCYMLNAVLRPEINLNNLAISTHRIHTIFFDWWVNCLTKVMSFQVKGLGLGASIWVKCTKSWQLGPLRHLVRLFIYWELDWVLVHQYLMLNLLKTVLFEMLQKSKKYF